jgi:hypothetical protein
MRTSALAIAVVVTTVAWQVSLAQQSPANPTPRTPSTASTVSDSELETFASIYVDLMDTAAKFDAEIKAAQTEEQALAVRSKVQTESIAKVEKRGWTPEKFNSVSEAIDNDPALTQKAAALIEQR